jgi:hypothetical protein
MALDLQVISLAGQGASVEDISSELELEPAAVKLILNRHGMLREEEISDDEFNDIRNGLVELARNSSNEFIRSKVGMFLYERKKGPSSLKSAPIVNIASLNMLIANSHAKIVRSLTGDESNRGRPQGDIVEEAS